MAGWNLMDRNERPTERRRRRARDLGSVARSHDLGSSLLLSAGLVSLAVVGPSLVDRMTLIVRTTLTNAVSFASSPLSLVDTMISESITMLLPVFAVLLLVGLVANIAQVGLKVSFTHLVPRFDRLSLTAGLRKLVSAARLVSIVRDSLKISVVAIILWLQLKSEIASIVGLGSGSIQSIPSGIGGLFMVASLSLVGSMVLISIGDYLFVRAHHESTLAMSRQELRDEKRESELPTEVRSRLRQRSHRLSRENQTDALPKADVVLTDSNSIAVALAYETSDDSSAPIVVTLGEGADAERIIRSAQVIGLPIVEDASLSRALIRMCDSGQRVPANLYGAVAELYAYLSTLEPAQVVTHD
jgi:flagellar biosynthetic protein FlhB